LPIIIGLMSGTSADGVDAAAFDIRRKKKGVSIKPIAASMTAYSPGIAEALTEFWPMAPVDYVMKLDVIVGLIFARAAKKLMRRLGLEGIRPALIGSHGQTVRHLPREKSTLQIGSAAHIAAITGVDVWSDFRRADMAAGGQGAPLAPVAHLPLFGHPRENRTVVNIGGIANITHIPAGAGSLRELIAYDTGPGNMLIDLVAKNVTGQPIDRNGRLAAGGKVNSFVLRRAMYHPYFQMRPPKSTGRETFGQAFLDELFPRGKITWSADLCATMTELTAASVEWEINQLSSAGRPTDKVIVCGGGALNGYLMERIARLCFPVKVVSSAEEGIDPMLVETALVALLAYHASRGEALDLSSITGSKRPVKLGVFTPSQ